MSTIRPDLPVSLPQTGASPATRATQADFFRAALSQLQPTQTSAVQTSAAQPTASRPAVTPITVEPARAPGESRSTRPGSLLDIRV